MIGLGQLHRMNTAATVDALIDKANEMDWYPYDVIGEIESEWIAEHGEQLASDYDLDMSAENFDEELRAIEFGGPMYDWPEEVLDKIEAKLREELDEDDEETEEDDLNYECPICHGEGMTEGQVGGSGYPVQDVELVCRGCGGAKRLTDEQWETVCREEGLCRSCGTDEDSGNEELCAGCLRDEYEDHLYERKIDNA
jgi:hypothetical protein